MAERIHITNKTMELQDCKGDWFFNEKHGCWCLEDILYTEKAAAPEFQRLSIYIPAEYMKEKGEVSPEGKSGKYTALTAPVILQNNSAGYMQMPHLRLDNPRCSAGQFLDRGFVFVTCGNRGSESKDEKGNWCGKSPANLVDLKTVIRFLRHNRASLPGDLEKIISVGTSAGGAMSSLLGLTGNHEDYLPYLKENGAFMEERDDVYASQIYCPIVDLEHADLAYEWMFSADKENEASHAGPAGVMTPFEEALSHKLRQRYITYFNGLDLKAPKGSTFLEPRTPLKIGDDGRSGSGYEYLMNLLNESASLYLSRLQAGELEERYSVEDYLAGNYEYKTIAPREERKEEAGEKEAGKEPALGDRVSRPAEETFLEHGEPPMITVQGKDKRKWLSWDGEKAEISGLDEYILSYRRRMKPCTSFDTLGMNSGENRVFGDGDRPYMHFNPEIAEAIAELRQDFLKGVSGDLSEEARKEVLEKCERYYEAYKAVAGDKELAKRVYLYNPLNYIKGKEGSKETEHFRIRVGAYDADTSLTISMTLALKLAEAGKDVDYALVWDKPHCDADYPGEVCDWIEKICG
ncbi:MAG: hypothetical protein NC400_10360 [Clostridium sp.]|nr:hypothetical protein [Clostridium sp.]